MENISLFMIDIGLYGHPDYFGFRREDAHLIDDEEITKKLTDLPMRVYEKR